MSVEMDCTELRSIPFVEEDADVEVDAMEKEEDKEKGGMVEELVEGGMVEELVEGGMVEEPVISVVVEIGDVVTSEFPLIH